VIEARQTDFMPIPNTFYTLESPDIYKNYDDSHPGPASKELSRGWTMAIEFVYRTALRQQVELPDADSETVRDGFMICFKRKGSEGYIRVFVTDDYKKVKLLGITSIPATKDGLQVTVLLPTASFAADEPVKFHVQFKNVSKKPFTLYDADYFWGWTMRFEDVKAGGPWRLEDRAKDQLRPVPVSKTLSGSNAWDVPVDHSGLKDRGFFVWEGEQSSEIPDIDHLKPGKYRLTIVIALKAGEIEDLVTYWTGTITSNPIDFEIAEKPTSAASRPATQARTVFRAYWLTSSEPDEYVVLLISKEPIQRLSGTKLDPTTALPDAISIVATTYAKDSIWNVDQRPFKMVDSVKSVDPDKKEIVLSDKRYGYAPASLRDVIALLEKPDGTIPIHRIHRPLAGAEVFANELLGKLKDQLKDEESTVPATQAATQPETQEQVVAEIIKWGGIRCFHHSSSPPPPETPAPLPWGESNAKPAREVRRK